MEKLKLLIALFLVSLVYVPSPNLIVQEQELEELRDLSLKELMNLDLVTLPKKLLICLEVKSI